MCVPQFKLPSGCCHRACARVYCLSRPTVLSRQVQDGIRCVILACELMFAQDAALGGDDGGEQILKA